MPILNSDIPYYIMIIIIMCVCLCVKDGDPFIALAA